MMARLQIMKQLDWTWANTTGFRSRICFQVFFEVLSVAFGLLFVFWSKRAVDIAMDGVSGSLKLSLFYIVLSVVLSVVFDVFASWISESVKIKMTIKLQNSLIDNQMQSIWTQTKRWHTGDLLVRINSDCSEVVQMLAFSFPMFIVTLIKFAASVGFLWIMDPMLAWMILSISPLLLFSKLYYRKVRELSQDVKQAESRVGTMMQENLRNRLLIKALQVGGIRRDKLFGIQEGILILKIKQLVFSSLTQGVIKITFNGGYLLAFVWGIYRLHSHEISFGTMTAFLQLVGKIQMPIFSLIAFLPAAIRCTTAIDRLLDLYGGDKEKEEKPCIVRNISELVIEDVSFRYEDEKVIDGFTAHFEAGIPVAIQGVSGKGKTTLIRLILSLLEPDSGSIYLCSDVGKLPVSKRMRTNFTYVPQGNSLFTGTIRENLLMANLHASSTQIKEVLRIACADFVQQLPEGLDTVIGESGFGLSEGQAQRIAIARALLRDSSVWLFDEITSALDENTSKQLFSNLVEAGREKIVIFVTHDLYLAQYCSKTIHIH